MRQRWIFITGAFLSVAGVSVPASRPAALGGKHHAADYLNNQPPLRPNPYIELPLGSIHPEGWLKEELLRMKKGMTGHLDSLYPQVMGQRNGWLGGDGDVWERGPYWIDGLLPLAYILDDRQLKAKAQKWVEWSLRSQDSSGYFGPKPRHRPIVKEAGLQKNKPQDWWPKMVMLKVLQQYYSATSDPRVITLMTNYFHYQLRQLPLHPLDHWSWWGAQRGGDNMLVVYWLYNITHDASLLKLADLLFKQTVDWTGMLGTGNVFGGFFKLHGVNLAMGIKEPIIYYQQHPEMKYYRSVLKGLKDIRERDGQPEGLYGADEWLHGRDPVNGSELCTAVEMMFSLENILQITGNVSFADRLERVAFNALPTQVTDDFMERQYFQQPNQVMLTRHKRNFFTEYDGTEQVYGLLTGYPCCTANLHQGWPKFTQNLWYATATGGVAALLYAPSSVKLKVADEAAVTITEKTKYPFRDRISFKMRMAAPATFPFHLRIPAWCREGIITINDTVYKRQKGNSIAVINRTWKDGDQVELKLPMQIRLSRWYENAVTVERGPLVYALKVKEQWTHVNNTDKYGPYDEVRPLSPWNYGLLKVPVDSLQSVYKVSEQAWTGYPWDIRDAPVTITAPARRLPFWKLYNGSAGPLPYSVQKHTRNLPVEEVELIPYGCTTLRITEFPEVM